MPTTLQWVAHLEQKIQRQCRYAAPYEQRYRNQYVLPFIASEYREVYGGDRVDQLLTAGPTPPLTGAAAVTVDALVERLTVNGATVEGDDETSRAAARRVQAAWDDNDLDVMHREAHREAHIKSRAFAQVVRGTDGRAVVGIESPEQMAVHREQGPPYSIDRSLKVWRDEWTDVRHARFEQPGRVVHLYESEFSNRDPEAIDDPRMYRWVIDREEQTRLTGVGVVEFQCRPRLLVEPISEIEPITSLVDVSDLIDGLMVFAGHFGAVPIRYAAGLDVPRDPKDETKPLLGPDGRPVVGFRPRADHLWVSTSKDTTFGQLTPAGLDSFVTWAEHVSSRLRAKTTVPSSYYGMTLKSHMTAELLKVDEAPMVRRVLAMGRDGSFNQAWRRVNQLILQIEDPSSRVRVLPRWADPGTRMESQAVDAFSKGVTGGLGVQTAAETFLGWAPDLAKRAVDEARAEQDRVRALTEGFGPFTGEGGGSAGLELVS